MINYQAWERGNLNKTTKALSNATTFPKIFDRRVKKTQTDQALIFAICHGTSSPDPHFAPTHIHVHRRIRAMMFREQKRESAIPLFLERSNRQMLGKGKLKSRQQFCWLLLAGVVQNGGKENKKSRHNNQWIPSFPARVRKGSGAITHRHRICACFGGLEPTQGPYRNPKIRRRGETQGRQKE